MIEQVSWKEFLIALVGGCAAYYGLLAVVIKIRFGRHRSSNSFPLPAYPGKKKISGSHSSQPVTEEAELHERSPETADDTKQTDDPPFTALELLADELQVITAQFAKEPTSKEELLGRLRKEIARYPTLNQPAFQRAVNNLIIKMAHDECRLTITPKEAKECWPV